MTSYKTIQQRKMIEFRKTILNVPGGGLYRDKAYEHILFDPRLNLWTGIREDAIDYFNRNNIAFWGGCKLPTGNMLSSQVACLNFLYFLRQREDVATSILQSIDANVRIARKMPDGPNSSQSGFVNFEVTGERNYLHETSWGQRGVHSTSLDAVILAELQNNQRKLFVFEWKYTEQYKGMPSKADEVKKGQKRLETYMPFLEQPDCPIKGPFDQQRIQGLFTEPYYQLMRQVLLAHEIVKAQEWGVTEYLHVHVIPQNNEKLLNVNTALPNLEGTSLAETWANQLKQPERYRSITPQELLEPATSCDDTTPWLNYLKQRYGE